jgi:hypothetical protein
MQIAVRAGQDHRATGRRSGAKIVHAAGTRGQIPVDFEAKDLK